MASDVEKVTYVAIAIAISVLVIFLLILKKDPHEDVLKTSAAIIGFFFFIPIVISVYSIVLQSRLYQIWINRQETERATSMENINSKLSENENLLRLRRHIVSNDYDNEKDQRDEKNIEDIDSHEKALTLIMFQEIQSLHTIYIETTNLPSGDFKIKFPGLNNLFIDWFKSPLIKKYWKEQENYFLKGDFNQFINTNYY